MIFFLAFLFSTLVIANPSTELNKQFQKGLAEGEFAGAAIAVVEQGKVTFIKAYGVRKKGEKTPVDLDTVFQIGSLSKSVTASLIANLQTKKMLSIYTPAIRQILSHTTGYQRAGWNSKIESGWSRSQLLQQLHESELTTPGMTYDYHNLAYSQIEDVVQDATKIPFKRAMQQYLFDPAGMKRTTLGFADFKAQQNKAWPHEKTKKRYQASKSYSHRYHDTVMSAAGVNSSIRDMAKFLQLQFKADSAPLFEPVTSAPDAKRWFRHFRRNDVKSYYGYGWRIVDLDGERIVFHGGWLKGFINFIAFSPKHQTGIVILCNTDTSFGFRTAMKFLSEKLSRSPLSADSAG